MLNRKHPVVTNHAQVGNKVVPPSLVVPVSNRAEYPTTLTYLSIRFHVQVAVDAAVDRVDARIFGVNMEYGALRPQISNSRNGIDSLPPEVRRIKVAANVLTRRSAKFEDRLRVIDDEARVRLDTELNVVCF